MAAPLLEDRLWEGIAKLGLAVPEAAVAPLLRHVELLLKWNQTVNLTAITDPAEVIEKHVLDSLAVAAHVPAGALLDAGTGGGFPGIPIRLVRPEVQVFLVDSVGKKVAFLKNVIADLRLSGAKALSLRLEGRPEQEGLPLADSAVARAFTSPAEWLALARHYVKPGGTILSMAGPRDPMPDQQDEVVKVKELEFALPFSGGQRRLGVYRRGD
jgi:16S rRNA (guanine527-N7)-methyltransferase